MLIDKRIRDAKPENRPKRLKDGHGLYLIIRPDGAKWWRFDFRFGKRRQTMSFGVFPEVSLQEAREKHQQAREALRHGKNPLTVRQAAKVALVRAQGETFRVVGDEWLKKRVGVKSPATVEKNGSILRHALYPAIGDVPIADLTAPMLLKALQALEARGKFETAHRARETAGQVLRYAIATSRTDRDCSADLKGAIPPPKVRHHPAPTDPGEIGALMRAIDGFDGRMPLKLALKLLALTFVRPGELQKAEWSEVDLVGKLWTVPARRMKGRKDHLVPLSRQALQTLEALKDLTGHSTFLFPNPRTRLQPMSENALNVSLRRMGYGKDELTAHGFRAMARTYLDETLELDTTLLEVQLSHTVPGPLGATYNRSQYLAKRADLLQKWADELDRLRG